EWVAGSGLPAEGVAFDDGSGLSDNDRLTCSFLSAALARDGADGPIAAGLAVPGRPGTLDDRMLTSSVRDRVRAEAGPLRLVAAVAGGLRTGAGRDVSFSILVNTPDRQITAADEQLQHRVLEAMTAYPRIPGMEALSPAPP